MSMGRPSLSANSIPTCQLNSALCLYFRGAVLCYYAHLIFSSALFLYDEMSLVIRVGELRRNGTPGILILTTVAPYAVMIWLPRCF